MNVGNENENNVVIVEHIKSPDFVSANASGVIVGGPAHGDLFYLIFYADMIDVAREVGQMHTSPPDKNGFSEVFYKLSVNQNDIINFREDKARIVMTRQGIMALIQMLNSQLQAPSEVIKMKKDEK